jgi:cytochrome c55X
MKTADFPRQFERFGVGVAHVVMAMSFAWHSMGDVLAETGEPPSSLRAQALVRMVRQDCGSCHGMLLTGGLGPAITPQALRDIPVDSVAATIYHGRPGTPMPPWKAMVNESEARWMAERLLAGFPTENTR